MEHQLSDAGEGAIPVRAGLLLASVRVASCRGVSTGKQPVVFHATCVASRRTTTARNGSTKAENECVGAELDESSGRGGLGGGGGRAARREEAVAGRMTHGDGGRWVANLDERRRAFQSR